MASRGVTIVPPPMPRSPDATPAAAPVAPSMKAVGHDIFVQLASADCQRLDALTASECPLSVGASADAAAEFGCSTAAVEAVCTGVELFGFWLRAADGLWSVVAAATGCRLWNRTDCTSHGKVTRMRCIQLGGSSCTHSQNAAHLIF